MREPPARARLLAVLGEIDARARANSAERCPYRAADDACTFAGGCRNRTRTEAGASRCAGGHLSPRPAAGEPLAMETRR